jgi:hypothetical protein
MQFAFIADAFYRGTHALCILVQCICLYSTKKIYIFKYLVVFNDL